MKLNTRKTLAMLASCAALAFPASLSALTIDFSGSGGLANSYSYTNIGGTGLNLTVTAFTKQSAGSGSFLSAKVGRYSPGLGVTNDGANSPGGAPYSDGNHEVDNIGYLDFLLFSFSGAVDLNSVQLDYIGADSDFQLWIGNSSNPATLFGGVSQSVNGNDGGWNDSSTYNVNPLNLVGTDILLAAHTGSDFDDSFKVRKFTFDFPPTNTPGVPDGGSTAVLLGASMIGLGLAARRKLS